MATPTTIPASAQLTGLLEEITSLPAEALPALLAQLHQAEALILLRLCGNQSAAAAPPERLLDITEAARRLNVSEDYLYRHWKRLPFARREPWGLRFSETGLDSYIRNTRR